MSAALATAPAVGPVRVDYEEIYRLAGVWRQIAEDVSRAALAVTAIALDWNLTEVLDPVGAFRTKHRIADALAGPGGLGNLALRLQTDAVELYAVVAQESIVDDLPKSEALSFERWAVKAPLRFLANPLGTLSDGRRRLDDLFEATFGYVLPVVDVGGLIARTSGVGVPVAGDLVVGQLAEVLGAGAGSAIPSTAGDTMATAPLGSLAQVFGIIGDLYDGSDGTIAIQAVSSRDGITRYVVELPGVENAALTSSHPQNFLQAGGALLATSSAYSRAVVTAMRAAAVPAGADVMLVGHSEGGIVAMNLAGDPAFNGGYVKVTHVVAAGSPISSKNVAAGSGTKVLSVENTNDLVTHLDLKDSGDRRASVDWLTYQFSDDQHSLVANHELGRYAEHLVQVEHGPNPLMHEFLGSASGYLDGPVSTQTFVLANGAVR